MTQIFETAAPDSFIESFAQARELYLKQHGDQAIMAFEGCSAQHTDFAHKADPVSLMYLERRRLYKIENPGPDWDGAWKLESK